MPIEIVTIVNSSGKIISNGKHLVNAFKEAKAAYDEKKAALKVERAIRRCQTFDTSAAPRYEPEPQYEHGGGRYAIDDGASQASSRRSHRSKHGRKRSASQARPALTVGNLRTHSEVSSVTPSRPPDAYRSPYAETAPKDMALSRPNLGRAPTMPASPTTGGMVHAPMENQHVQRSRSDPSLQETGKKKEVDMDDLAYGSIPPDLADRVDLDPAHKIAEKEEEAETARTLIEKIEDLLMEAQCVHHTANHIIEHLQGRPEAAAAVALALAELSALLGKMSPSFLAILKGGSPAIFALLASPQFLIAAGLAVGVTVVMFGGWKIVRQVKEAKEAQAAARMPAMAFEAHPSPPAQPEQPSNAPYPQSEASQGFDEALVMEEELSTIETWRRGIAPFGEDETADMELISPEADRAIRSQYGGDDTRTERSVRTTRTHKSSKSHKRHERHESSGSRAYDGDVDGGVSEAGSRRSHRSHRSPQTHRTQKTEKTEPSSKTKRSSRTTVRALEDGGRDKENTIEAVLRPKKDKKKDSGNSMFKNIIEKMKKKEDEKERASMLRVA